MDSKGGKQLHVSLLLDFLTLCEYSGYIQLKIPLIELVEKLEDLWSQVFSLKQCGEKDTSSLTTARNSGNIDTLSADTADEANLIEKEEAVGKMIGEDRGSEEEMVVALVDVSKKTDGEEDEILMVEEEERGEVSFEEEEQEEIEDGEMDGFSWDVRTPDSLTCTDEYVDDNVSSSPSTSGRQGDEVITCLNFDNLSTTTTSSTCATGTSLSPSCMSSCVSGSPVHIQSLSDNTETLPTHGLSASPITPPSHSPPKSLSHSPPNSPSHSSPNSLSHSLPNALSHSSPNSPSHSPPNSPSHSPPNSPSHSAPNSPSHSPLSSPSSYPSHSPLSPHMSPTLTSPSPSSIQRETQSVQPPLSSSNDVGWSTVIIIDSSDEEEEADCKLEQLFVDMKLQSSKKTATKIHSRKSLSEFIISDSEVEEISDNETMHGGVREFSPIFKTHQASTDNYEAALSTPLNPFASVMFHDGSINGENSPPTYDCGRGMGKRRRGLECVTVPPRVHRRPLEDKNNHITTTNYTPGDPLTCKTGVYRSTATTTTPSANKTFKRHKKTMAQELYNLFNHSVFNDELPVNMELAWNSKLRTTAGYCRNSGTIECREARIELSSKVIDNYDRLRNTLIHEMCHAAVWLIDGVKNGGHKRHWQAWALKANTVHPDLDTITRCHSYDISYKYSYKCTRCDYKLGRHSKSVNLTTARCPYCRSSLELEPRLNPDGTLATTAKLNRYAQFVKDNYTEVKLQTLMGGHRAVMERLREQYYNNSRIPVLNLECVTED